MLPYTLLHFGGEYYTFDYFYLIVLVTSYLEPLVVNTNYKLTNRVYHYRLCYF